MASKKTKDPQSVAADVNEIWFGYYLTDSWKDFENSEKIQTELKERTKRISGEEAIDQKGRAKEMGKVVVEWIEENMPGEKIVKKWWPKQDSGMISKAIGSEVDLKKNPLDILIKTDKGNFVGFSAKSIKQSWKIPKKNRGLGSVGKELGLVDLTHIFDDEEKKMLSDLKEIKGKTRKDRKEWCDKNEPYYEKNIQKSKYANAVFTRVQDEIFKKLKSMSDKELTDYIAKSWIDSVKLNPPYMIVKGRGVKEKYFAKIEDPLDVKFGIIKIEKEGMDKVRILSDDKKIMDMRVKFMSKKMVTSVKFSGE